MKYSNYSGIFRYWWVPIITGILSIAIGVYCFCSPMSSMEALAIFFEAAMIVAGIFNLSFAISNMGRNHHWGWPLANGLIEILLGVWLWTMPLTELTAVFVYAVGFWLLFVCVYGIGELTALTALRSGWIGWLLAFLVIAAVCVFISMITPLSSGIMVWLFIGTSFIAYGITRILLAIQLRKLSRR